MPLNMPPLPPLILTLMLDPASFAIFNRLRKRHFPHQRNLVPAHITLFHTLPADRENGIRQMLQQISERMPAFALSFSKIRFLGRGVAVEIDCPELIGLRRELAAAWEEWLSAQDRQKYRPHVTIQNKVKSEQARELYRSLSSDWNDYAGRGEGLLLWRYSGGPWELVSEFNFAGGNSI